jgi:hypothetical protein
MTRPACCNHGHTQLQSDAVLVTHHCPVKGRAELFAAAASHTCTLPYKLVKLGEASRKKGLDNRVAQGVAPTHISVQGSSFQALQGWATPLIRVSSGQEGHEHNQLRLTKPATGVRLLVVTVGADDAYKAAG